MYTSTINKKFDHFHVINRSSQVQWRSTKAVWFINVSSFFQGKMSHVRVPGACYLVQYCLPMFVGKIDVSSILQ